MTDLSLSAPHLRWHGRTDKGIRANNEDAFLGLQFDAHEVRYLGRIGEARTGEADFIFAVSDGMGGSNAGEFASRIVVDKVTRLMPKAFKRSALGISVGFEDVFAQLFAETHKALNFLAWGDPDCAGMGATLSMGWFTPGWIHFAHVGDSRIYYLPAGKNEIKQLTHDDTYVGWLYRQGKISEREARHHPGRSSLQKALGGGNQFVDPQVGAVGYQPGDIFLFCTDGVVEGLFDSDLLSLLRRPDPLEAAHDPASRLITASLSRASRDNNTVLVVEVM